METKISHAGVIRAELWQEKLRSDQILILFTAHFALYNAVTFWDGMNSIGLTIPLGAFIHLFILYEDGLIQCLCCKSEMIPFFPEIWKYL